MENELLANFRPFFHTYMRTWNDCDIEAMCQICAPDLHVRWAYPSNDVSDWGCEEACEGWRQAFAEYAGRHPKWHFQEVFTTPVSENEVLATFWVTFEMDGKPTAEVTFFVETFRREPSEWKLIRSYVEVMRKEHVVIS